MKFTVEVNFVSPKEIRGLNRQRRGQNYTPAVLSFSYFEPTDEGMLLGEVLICKSEARKLAKNNEVTVEEQINQLVIHGIKHLIGVHED
ncbi:rRNA maturation RNase YbeY [Candidatus Saccharibacteria bacterium]|nr:rRNA maturation RNase YbeY [Candidatus Saccharibacteria bacterium]